MTENDCVQDTSVLFHSGKECDVLNLEDWAEVELSWGDWTKWGQPSWLLLKFSSWTCCHMLTRARLVDFQLVVQLAYQHVILACVFTYILHLELATVRHWWNFIITLICWLPFSKLYTYIVGSTATDDTGLNQIMTS